MNGYENCASAHRFTKRIEILAGVFSPASENAVRQDRGVDAGTRFFVRSARESRTFAGRKAMIDRKNDDLPVSRQAKVLGISRGSVYYLPRTVSADDLALMRRIDELHLDYPFAAAGCFRIFWPARDMMSGASTSPR